MRIGAIIYICMSACYAAITADPSLACWSDESCAHAHIRGSATDSSAYALPTHIIPSPPIIRMIIMMMGGAVHTCAVLAEVNAGWTCTLNLIPTHTYTALTYIYTCPYGGAYDGATRICNCCGIHASVHDLLPTLTWHTRRCCDRAHRAAVLEHTHNIYIYIYIGQRHRWWIEWALNTGRYNARSWHLPVPLPGARSRCTSRGRCTSLPTCTPYASKIIYNLDVAFCVNCLFCI